MAVASALAEHHWAEPYVSEMSREEAKRELDDMIEKQETLAEGNHDSAQEQSSDYGDGKEGEEVKEDPTGDDDEDSESDSESDSSEEKPPIWPKGVVGL
ncbi:hypothetical protein BR93DRAFT_926556, partial [Coniochaeta sp. PMI_546]